MKYIQVVSDLHLEFDAIKNIDNLWYPPITDDDADTTLVIAGDIWSECKFNTRKHSNGRTWLEHIAERYKFVVLVLGNHDYWGININLDKLNIDIPNVYHLENNSVVLDQVKFVGATLWTDFARGNPVIMHCAKLDMNDYRYIRAGSNYSKVTPEQIYKKHVVSKNYIFDNSTKDYPDQTLCVVTHMAPCLLSIEEWRRYNNRTTECYYSDLYNEVADSSIDYWIHGHVHHSNDYNIENTRVISNPRGYKSVELNVEFNPIFRIEV